MPRKSTKTIDFDLHLILKLSFVLRSVISETLRLFRRHGRCFRESPPPANHARLETVTIETRFFPEYSGREGKIQSKYIRSQPGLASPGQGFYQPSGLTAPEPRSSISLPVNYGKNLFLELCWIGPMKKPTYSADEAQKKARHLTCLGSEFLRTCGGLSEVTSRR